MEKEERICSETLLYDNGIIWFTDIFDNKLYLYDMAAKNTSLFYVFEEEKPGQERLFSRIEKKDNFLFCVPFSANALYIIDITSKTVERKEIMPVELRKYADYIPDSKFASSAWYQDSLFLIGAAYPAIVQYDTLAGTIIYHTEWVDEIREKFKTGKDFIFRKSCVVGKCIFAPCCRSNCVMEFDMETKKYKIHELDTDVNGFTAICSNKDMFWLIPRRGTKVVCWNVANRTVEEYIFLKNEKESMNLYNDLLEEDEDHIILLAGAAGTTIRLNTREKVTEKISQRLYNVGVIVYAGRRENTIYAFSRYSKILILITGKNVSFRKIYYPQCEKETKEREGSVIRYEDDFDSLEDLIDELRESDQKRHLKQDKKSNGKVIWEYIKKI